MSPPSYGVWNYGATLSSTLQPFLEDTPLHSHTAPWHKDEQDSQDSSLKQSSVGPDSLVTWLVRCKGCHGVLVC